MKSARDQSRASTYFTKSGMIVYLLMKANKRVFCSHTLRPSYFSTLLLQRCIYSVHDEEVERRNVPKFNQEKKIMVECDDGKWIVLKVSKEKMYFSIDLLQRLHGFIISSSIKELEAPEELILSALLKPSAAADQLISSNSIDGDGKQKKSRQAGCC